MPNESRELLDLVSVTNTAEVNDREKNTAFYKIKTVCSLSGIKAEQPCIRALSRQRYNYGPPACDVCEEKRHTANYLGYRVLLKSPPYQSCTTPRVRAHGLNYIKLRTNSGGSSQRPVHDIAKSVVVTALLASWEF
ncbi:hypothetical protein EVAR_55760_1 [Eumeta japonica]|uniref:Uncharacterized protein n=1 Tax=Eumeta variegata TaxID=151549 RepID=A0A4C1XC73_EUMVA|nr:hypothetical protein EVAR_55760_1 [Eumeta japonica]